MDFFLLFSFFVILPLGESNQGNGFRHHLYAIITHLRSRPKSTTNSYTFTYECSITDVPKSTGKQCILLPQYPGQPYANLGFRGIDFGPNMCTNHE